MPRKLNIFKPELKIVTGVDPGTKDLSRNLSSAEIISVDGKPGGLVVLPLEMCVYQPSFQKNRHKDLMLANARHLHHFKILIFQYVVCFYGALFWKPDFSFFLNTALKLDPAILKITNLNKASAKMAEICLHYTPLYAEVHPPQKMTIDNARGLIKHALTSWSDVCQFKTLLEKNHHGYFILR